MSARRCAFYQGSLFVCVAVLAAFLCLQEKAYGQSAAEKAVKVSAVAQKSPPRITLNWPSNLNAKNTHVYRKQIGEAAWGSAIASLPGDAVSYVDQSVSAGIKYEYQVEQNTILYGSAYGYIAAGIEVPLVDYRGKVVLIVDNTFAADLAAELARLEQDLVGDGWIVLRHDVSRAEKVANVKSLIKADYDSDPENVRAVFLFGHVPVPYAGAIAPDGHESHFGAWPTDAFYGDMDGIWTDEQNLTIETSGPQSNIKGDGKYDQSVIPGALELQVGRVDLSDLPAFAPKTELDLLRQYLNKDHSFRHHLLTVERRALIDDNFGYMNGEAFAASGWRNFNAFFGAANVEEKDWFTTLTTQTYLWAYGSGGGKYTSAEGIGSTHDFAAKDPRVVFTMLFGSWFGDWDTKDNFLRAPLATNTYGLTSAWAGRPHWHFEHMALGETIGYSTRLTQNASNALYPTNWPNSIHLSLMGDPTLRMFTVAPPSALRVAATPTTTGSVSLNWTASPDSVLGYHVYRANAPSGPFSKINSALIQGTSFIDASAPTGASTYMVRAVKLETSASGTYFNASQGITATLGVHSLGGRLTDQSGNALRDVIVTLSGSRTGVARTRQNGNYSFGNLASGGNYIVMPSAPATSSYGFQPQSRTFNNLSANHADAHFTATPDSVPKTAPALLTEENSLSAVGLDSVTWIRGPFPLITTNNLSRDHRARITLFAVNVSLMPINGASALTAQAEDSQNNIYPLTVEFVGAVSQSDWLTQIILKLPDELASRSEIWLSINYRGVTSKSALVNIKPSGEFSTAGSLFYY
ncbi:MAG TPA: hypothetical protein VF658_04615 [Pyrinomonadaceae bacterium]|jgi:hypothetical protein